MPNNQFFILSLTLDSSGTLSGHGWPSLRGVRVCFAHWHVFPYRIVDFISKTVPRLF